MRSTGRRPFFAVLIGVVLAGGAETAVAQQPPSGADAPRSGLLISTDSGYDTAESGSGDARAARRDSPGRLHAEWFRLASTRRSVVRFWTGVTAGVPDSDRTHAEAFAFAASTVLSRRTHFDFDARVNAAPVDLFSALGSAGPSATPVTTTSSSFTEGRMITYDARAVLSRALGARTSMNIELSHTGSSTERRGVRNERIGGLVRRRIGPFSTIRAGYAFDVAVAASSGAQAIDRRHDVDLGVDYARPLSFSRHTQIGFGTGTSVLTNAMGRRLRLALSSSLARDWSRAWSARLEYNRPIEYLAGFAQPFLSDAVTVGANGRLGRRTTLTLASGFSRGGVGFGATRPQFSSRSTSGRLTVPMGRAWAVEFEAHDARYQLGAAVPLPSFIPERFVRRGARLGFVWSSPWTGR